MVEKDFDTIEDVKKFSGCLGSYDVKKINEIIEDANARNKVVCFDLSDVGWISRDCAELILYSSMPIRVSEPVKMMMEVVSSE